jgi:phosphopantothenoylcysteine decarboxylase
MATTTPAPAAYAYNPAYPNILLFATGSVATIKLPLLVDTLLKYPVNLIVILSPTARRFLTDTTLDALSRVVKLYTNEDEWLQPWNRGDPVLHIELRKWADMLLIAPLSAHSLASMAGGLCAGLGLSVVRAWDTTAKVGDRGVTTTGSEEKKMLGKRKMILVAPAMNTQMYLHPLTEEHLAKLREWGWVRILKPVEKLLACGDLGVGGMMEVPDIVAAVLEELGLDPSATTAERV